MNSESIMAKLEPLGWRHAPDIQRAVKDPGMRECSNIPRGYFNNGAQSLIRRGLQQSKARDGHMLALYAEEDLAGVFNIQLEDNASGWAHLYFWLEAECWRSGRAKEYFDNVLQFARTKLKGFRLRTSIKEGNTLCTRCLEGVGFRRVARVKTRPSVPNGEETELIFEFPGRE